MDAPDPLPPGFGENQKLSAFNMAQLDLYRLHVLLSDANTQSRSGDLFGWKRTLDTLFREVSPKFSDDEIVALHRIIEKVVNPRMRAYTQASNMPSWQGDAAVLMDEAYSSLESYEIFLRRKLSALGIVLPSRGVRSALGGGD